MIQDELDSLPIAGEPYYEQISLPDDRFPNALGQFINIPHITAGKVMTIDNDDYAVIIDREGQKWSTGSIDGIKYKQRVYI